MNCVCQIEINNDDYCRVEVLRRSEPVARKEHRCHECGRTIRVGEKYVREATVCEGALGDEVFCADCESLQGLVCGRLYGGLREAIFEAVRWGGIEPTAPAIRALTPAARDWLCDMIEATWKEESDVKS
jgi:hypothetical protein